MIGENNDLGDDAATAGEDISLTLVFYRSAACRVG